MSRKFLVKIEETPEGHINVRYETSLPRYAGGLEYRSQYDLASLRNCLNKSQGRKPLLAMFVDYWSGFVGDIVQIFNPIKTNNSMCKYYGHVIGAGAKRGSGGHPVCQDCGAPVKDPADLRKAVPTRGSRD